MSNALTPFESQYCYRWCTIVIMGNYRNFMNLSRFVELEIKTWNWNQN